MQAFFDDSASSSGVVILAGFLADDESWAALSYEWTSLLSRHNMKRLHTADFLAGKSEYAGLGLSWDDRVIVVSEFLALLRKHVRRALCASVESAPYKELMNRFPKPMRIGKPEDFCLLRILRIFTHAAIDLGVSSPVQLVFHDSTEDSMRFYGAYRRIREKFPDMRMATSGISFCDDRHFPPLQAADLSACLTSQLYARPGGPFEDALTEPDPAHGVLFTSEHWSREKLFGHPDLARAVSTYSAEG